MSKEAAKPPLGPGKSATNLPAKPPVGAGKSATNLGQPHPPTEDGKGKMGEGEKKPEPPPGPKKVEEDHDPYGDGPVFIYGGPWICVKKPSIFLEETTPLNVQLSGIFKNNYAYKALKDRLPLILRKVMDNGKSNASFVSFIAKLKHDLVTNKPYAKFTADDDETELWNNWIEAQSPKNYFGNNWVGTECYVYRKIQEGIQLNGLGEFDPFEDVKRDQFQGNVEPMCVVAEKMLEYIQPKEDPAKRKEEWVALLKVSLWANRCDLSQSAGEKADLGEVCPKPVLPFPKPTAKPKPLKKGKLPPVAPPLTDLGYLDPFQINLDLKSNLLADDSAKSFAQLISRTNKIRNNIQKLKDKNATATTFKQKCSCHRLARLANMPFQWDRDKPEPNWLEMFPSGKQKKAKGAKKKPAEPGAAEPPKEEPPKIACPAKMNVAQSVFLDIVCDNTGYELFSDLCIAHWVLAQGIVDKVRFHVKKYPWFVSDVTKKDFMYVVNQCKGAKYNKDAVRPPPPPPPGAPGPGAVPAAGAAPVTPPAPAPAPPAPAPAPPPAPAPGAPEPPPERRSIRSDALNKIATEWQKYIDEGKFLIFDEDFWTYPHTYNDMKRIDPYMYRNMQYAAMIIFKGDLNYRKLVGERNCVPFSPLEPNLQGFIPAPIVALRTVKSETVCALPKGRYEQLVKFDPEWMQKGNFGVITMCKKAEAFPKQPNMPCVDYGDTCFGEICPVHTDI